MTTSEENQSESNQTSSRPELISWAPRWSKYVEGAYEPRVVDPATRMCEPQKIYMKCNKCGDEWQTICSSGQVRQHIAKFARLHLHQDISNAPRVVRPGSMRGERKAGRADE